MRRNTHDSMYLTEAQRYSRMKTAMKANDKTGETQLTPRQALICAAVTGWNGDEPSSWPWPVSADNMVAFARSYQPEVRDMNADFQRLAEEGLFLRVCYPIFKRAYYACWYDSTFLHELPKGMTFPGWQTGERLSIKYVSAFWDELQAKSTDRYGAAFVWWGMCAGQGSQSGSSAWGPCLGPSCCCYTDGKYDECHHGLEFVRMPDLGFPDMHFLEDIHWPDAPGDEQQQTMDAAIAVLQRADSSLPCRTSEECDEACKHRSIR